MNVDRILTRLIGPALMAATAVWILTAGLVSA